MSAVMDGETVVDLLWPSDLFVDKDSLLPPIPPGGLDVDFELGKNVGGISGWFLRLIGQSLDNLAETVLFFAQVVYTLVRIVAQMIEWMINFLLVGFGFIRLLLKWLSFGLPEAWWQARLLYGLLVNGYLSVSIYQHWKKI